MDRKNIVASKNVQRNVELLERMLGKSSDLVTRDIVLEGIEKHACIVFLDGAVDSHTLETHVLEPLMEYKFPCLSDNTTMLRIITTKVLQVKSVRIVEHIEEAVSELLLGKTLVIIDGYSQLLSADTTKWSERSLSSPKGQRVIKGPDVGFTESRSTNISLIRKILKSSDLRVNTKPYGKKTSTDVSLVYLDGVVDKDILRTVMARLEEIDLDAVLESNYIEESLTKDSKSIFPLMLNTDRPDVIVAEILEGKVGIVVDGSPYVLVAPAVLIQFFQTPEDYYTISSVGKTFRLSKILIFIVSVYIPGVYVAFITHHPSLLPSKLLISFLSQRELVPMPTIVEVTLLTILIEAIYEASNRLPENVVITVSVFAAIVLGQSAVEAQLVQPVSLVVMSASFILNSVVPIIILRDVARYLKFVLIIFGTIFGLYGIFLLSLVLLFHLCSLRSFGVPYLSPISPFVGKDQKDVAVRFPLEQITNDPTYFTKEETMEDVDDGEKG